MSLRTEWEFEYTTEDVRNAADERSAYHAERLEFWQGEHAEVMGQIEEKGLDIRSREVTGGQRHEFVLDPELGNRLAECEQKIKNHTARHDQYELWFKVLDATDDLGRRLSLHHDDITFFGLHQKAKDEDD